MAASSKHIRYPSYPPSRSGLPHPILHKPEDVNPGYFIVRPNGGPLVPLIPIDELPVGVDLVGLKRIIEVEDTIGMANLGIRTNRVGHWKLFEKKDGSKDGGRDSGIVTAAVVAPKHPVADSATPPTTPPTATCIEATTATTPHIAAAPLASNQPPSASPSPPKNSSPPPPTTAPTAPKPTQTPKPAAPATTKPPIPPPTLPKPSTTTTTGIIGPFVPQICRHWCAYGLCKWSQNCRYLHIMPTTRTGLAEVGLADWPGWWRAIIGNLNGGNKSRDSGRREVVPVGKLSVYPTGAKERFTRGLDIDYGRSGGDAALAREWEDRLMRGRCGAGVVGGSGGGKGRGNGNGNGKVKKVGVGKLGQQQQAQYLQPVIKEGKVVGVAVGDGSALPKKNVVSTPTSTTEPVKTKGKEKATTQLKHAATDPRRQNLKKEVMTTEKVLDRDVARATMAWEDDEVEVSVDGDDENKENVAPLGGVVREAGVLVDI